MSLIPIIYLYLLVSCRKPDCIWLLFSPYILEYLFLCLSLPPRWGQRQPGVFISSLPAVPPSSQTQNLDSRKHKSKARTLSVSKQSPTQYQTPSLAGQKFTTDHGHYSSPTCCYINFCKQQKQHE